MADKTLVQYTIGEPFPGKIPQQEGCLMELWESLMIIIQVHGLRRDELMAFKKSFKRYAYLESPTSIPIAFFIFEFPPPNNFLDVNFTGAVCPQNLIEDYLRPINGQYSNLLTFYLLDQNIIKAIKPFGLHHTAVELFHATIRKQREMSYSQSDYDECLSEMYKHSSQELFNMGTKFKTKRMY